jgi:capsular polysaccharide biosynthesis protein
MDLGLYLRVLWRFRVVVAAGIAVSAGLALLTHARVDLDGGVPNLSHRTPLVWASTSTVLITENRFPWGASSLQDEEALEQGEKPKGPQYTDPNRFYSLAVLYARLAKSDDVLKIVASRGGSGGSYAVAPLVQEGLGLALPMLEITARGSSPQDARRNAQLATEAFRFYIANKQETGGIPPERRVRLEVVRSARSAHITSGRTPVKPVLALLVGLFATFGLAFLLENLRPRIHPMETSGSALMQLPSSQRPERAEQQSVQHKR